MLKIVIVNTWLVHRNLPDPYFEFQSQMLIKHLSQSKVEAQGLMLASKDLKRSSTAWRDANNNVWHLVEADDESPHRGPEVRSKALIEVLEDLAPDYVMLRGASSTLSKQLSKGRWRTIKVITSSTRGRNLLPLVDCDFALVETPVQLAQFSKILCDENVFLLPKQVPSFFGPTTGDQHFDVVAIGAFEPWKNHSGLSDIVQSGLRVALVGDGSLRAHYEYLWGEKENCTFFGEVSSVQVAQILQMSKLLVHPSLSEGLPRVVVEAMATGVPIVANKRTVQWPIVDSVNGRTVKEGQFTQAIDEILVNGKLESFRMAARKTYVDFFSESKFERSINEISRKLLGLPPDKEESSTERRRRIRRNLVLRSPMGVIQRP